jgi:hypothetical protein
VAVVAAHTVSVSVSWCGGHTVVAGVGDLDSRAIGVGIVIGVLQSCSVLKLCDWC